MQRQAFADVVNGIVVFALHPARGALEAGQISNREDQRVPRMGLTWATFASKSLKAILFRRELGAVEKTRTSTGCPTATSTLRVYQFRHDRTQLEAGSHRHRACSKSDLGKQAPFFKKTKKITDKPQKPHTGPAAGLSPYVTGSFST